MNIEAGTFFTAQRDLSQISIFVKNERFLCYKIEKKHVSASAEDLLCVLYLFSLMSLEKHRICLFVRDIKRYFNHEI